MAERDSTLAALREEDEALRLTGLNLHSLFERFPFAVQVYTPDGHPRYANPAHRMLWQQADDYRPPPDSAIFDTPRLAQMGRLADIRRGFAGESVTLPPALFTSSEMPTLAPETHRWVLTSL